MKIILLALILVFARHNAEAADQLWKHNNVTVILHERACQDAGIAMHLMMMRGVKEPMAASIDFRGKKLHGCWGEQPDGERAIIDADGDGGILSKDGFKPNAST